MDSLGDSAVPVPAPNVLPRVAAGDQRAVADCIDLYGGLVWSLSRRLLGVGPDSEDAVQEVFVDLWKSAGRYDPSIASERAFVAMIARRRLIDRLRSGRGKAQAMRGSVAADADSLEERSSRSAPLPIELREEAARAATALGRLSPEQQRAIKLSVWEGLSHQEIATRLDVPLGTVKTNLRRGLIRIRELLGDGDSRGTVMTRLGGGA